MSSGNPGVGGSIFPTSQVVIRQDNEPHTTPPGPGMVAAVLCVCACMKCFTTLDSSTITGAQRETKIFKKQTCYLRAQDY